MTTEATSPPTPDASPPSPSPLRTWLQLGLGLTAVGLIVAAAVGFSLRSWAAEHQVETLYSFATDYEELAELSRLEGSVATDYRTLATRAKSEPLTFLEFGVLVVLHRDHLEDGRLAPEEIKRQRELVRAILDGKFDPATFPNNRG